MGAGQFQGNTSWHSCTGFIYLFLCHNVLRKKRRPTSNNSFVAAMSNVLQYYFGASQGSNKKDEIISQQIKNQ